MNKEFCAGQSKSGIFFDNEKILGDFEGNWNKLVFGKNCRLRVACSYVILNVPDFEHFLPSGQNISSFDLSRKIGLLWRNFEPPPNKKRSRKTFKMVALWS